MIFLTPFYIKAEEQIDITNEDEGVIIKGKINTLVRKAYMLGNPHPDKPSFGMITTGGSFIFIKLVKGEVFQYGTSKIFEVRNPG